MKKRILIIGGGILVVILLAGAAFVGGRLLRGQGLPAYSPGGLMMFTSKGGQGAHSVQIHIQPAKDLPQTPPDVEGIFDHRQDNSFFVGTGQVTVMAHKDQSGNVTSATHHSGPVVEVVVTAQTVVYRDVTMQQYNGQPPSGDIQQVVEPGSLDEVGQESSITAWGKKTGDRLIASVLVYSPPAFIMKK